MILFINFSGGMGISYQGSVDFSTLPEDILGLAKTTFSEDNLSKLSAEEKNQFSTDSVTYEFQYKNSTSKFDVTESQLSNETLELIDSLEPYLQILPKKNKQE